MNKPFVLYRLGTASLLVPGEGLSVAPLSLSPLGSRLGLTPLVELSEESDNPAGITSNKDG